MFPLLHFLLPPGEENRGRDLHREGWGGFWDRWVTVLLIFERKYS
jgi:hypothetical protein